MSELGQTAAACFLEEYGQAPSGAWRAPGRVNIIGEHTDYNDGYVLPMALAAGVVVCAGRRDDNKLALVSQLAGHATVRLAELGPGSVSGWSAYPAGIAWALRAAGYPVGGASLAIAADLPAGAGLSSSAALVCAVGLALTDLYGLRVPGHELVTLASRAENDFVGAPTGIMDQSAALLCRPGYALLLDCRSGATKALPLDLRAAGLSLLVIDTRVRHELADGRYALRRTECEAAARAFGVASLREVPGGAEAVSGGEDVQADRADEVLADGGEEVLAALGDGLLRRRARHVLSENARVLKTARLIRDGDLGAVGDLLTESHVSLRDDFDVSWPQADAAVAAAVAGGALGARMMGGGFGGSVLALAPAGQVESITREVSLRFAWNGWQAPGFAPAEPSAGAGRLW